MLALNEFQAVLGAGVKTDFKDCFRSAARRADVARRDFFGGKEVAACNLSLLSVKNDALHRAYFAVHDAVGNDAEFFDLNLGALNELGPQGFSAMNFALVVAKNAGRNDDVSPLALDEAFADSAGNFDVAGGLDFVSVVHVALDDDAAQKVDVAGLDSDAFQFQYRFDVNSLVVVMDAAGLAGYNRYAVFVKLDVFAERNLNVLSVLCLKVAAEQGLSGLAALGLHFCGQRLALDDVLNFIEFLKVDLSVAGFLNLKLCRVRLKVKGDVSVAAVLRHNRVGDLARRSVNGIVNPFGDFVVFDAGDNALSFKRSPDLVGGDFASAHGGRGGGQRGFHLVL